MPDKTVPDKTVQDRTVPDKAVPDKATPDETVLEETELPGNDPEGVALSTERQLLFTDAVVAIAITLLALELPVPEGLTNGAVWHEALAHQDEYLAFLISFVVIWAHWSGHRLLFRSVAAFDPLLSRLNMLWLLMIVIMPFATKVINADGAFQARFGFYAVVQTLISVTSLLMAWHVKHARLERAGVPLARFTHSMRRSAVLASGFAVSIPVSFVTSWAFACWAALPLVTNAVPQLRRRPPAPAGAGDS